MLLNVPSLILVVERDLKILADTIVGHHFQKRASRLSAEK